MAQERGGWRLLQKLNTLWSLYKEFVLAPPILASTLTMTSVFTGAVSYKVIVAPPELEEKLSTLQDQASTLEGKISALQESVKSLENKVPTLEESVSTMEDQVPDLEKRIAAIAAQVSKWGETPGADLVAQCQWKESEIRHFHDGEHERLDSTGQKGLEELVKKMREHFEDHKTLQQLILLGRTDITPLKEGKRGFYGSNNGLAQARAKRVMEELKEKLPEWRDDIEQVALLLSAGPLHFGTANKEDRSVEVWACWTPKPKPQSVDSSTDSPETPQESATK